MANIVCWRSGECEVVSRVPQGTIRVIGGLPADRLQRALDVVARHAYDGKTRLVPGLPEADNDHDARVAVFLFQGALRDRLSPAKAGAGMSAAVSILHRLTEEQTSLCNQISGIVSEACDEDRLMALSAMLAGAVVHGRPPAAAKSLGHNVARTVQETVAVALKQREREDAA